jgi:uncharacterized protein (TIGR02145 family)
MKNMKLLLAVLFSFLLVQCKKESVPGIVDILSVENLTHNSVVIFSGITNVQGGVGLQFKGVCLDKTVLPVVGKLTFQGTSLDEVLENCMTGISGLEPATRYIVRAYFETNEGIVYSDSITITTKSTDWMTDARDGKRYPVKQFGKQVWMVQNLNYASPGSIVPDNISTNYPAEFGRLYTYVEAVPVCPQGWRLPSDKDWKELEKWIGIPEEELDKTAFRGSPFGGMMKEPGMRLWESQSALHSNNKSGFTVVPSGWYNTDKKEFTFSGLCAGFWVSSDDGKTAFFRSFYAHSDAVSRNSNDINTLQLSVRCIKEL